MTKEEVHELLTKIEVSYKLLREVDERIATCGTGAGYEMQWHVHKYEDFVKICKALEKDPLELENELYLNYNKVRIFVLKSTNFEWTANWEHKVMAKQKNGKVITYHSYFCSKCNNETVVRTSFCGTCGRHMRK